MVYDMFRFTTWYMTGKA